MGRDTREPSGGKEMFYILRCSISCGFVCACVCCNSKKVCVCVFFEVIDTVYLYMFHSQPRKRLKDSFA